MDNTSYRLLQSGSCMDNAEEHRLRRVFRHRHHQKWRLSQPPADTNVGAREQWHTSNPHLRARIWQQHGQDGLHKHRSQKPELRSESCHIGEEHVRIRTTADTRSLANPAVSRRTSAPSRGSLWVGRWPQHLLTTHGRIKKKQEAQIGFRWLPAFHVAIAATRPRSPTPKYYYCISAKLTMYFAYIMLPALSWLFVPPCICFHRQPWSAGRPAAVTTTRNVPDATASYIG